MSSPQRVDRGGEPPTTANTFGAGAGPVDVYNNLIEANLASTGLADRALVVPAAAERFLDRARAEGQRWDLALLDPPYAYDTWAELLSDLPADLAVVESDRAVDPPIGWGVVRQRRYGTTLVTVLRSIPSTGPMTGPAPPE
jgi:16S rRNA G966 N2-methylase RsmD